MFDRRVCVLVLSLTCLTSAQRGPSLIEVRHEGMYRPPTNILLAPSTVQGVEGGAAVLPCISTAPEQIVVSWYRLDQDQRLSVGSSILVEDARLESSLRTETHAWVLTISNLNLEDAGTYQCRVASPSSPTSANITLEVQGPCGDRYECDTGRCVPQSFLCDGDNDCGDFSDERGCSCDTGLLCNNGKCIPTFYQCDGDNDCGDYTDEMLCPCDGFRCNNQKCIISRFTCDGDNDCGDLSDELNCPCDDGILCRNSTRCLPLSYLCDGDNDCGDNSDEFNCNCMGYLCQNRNCVPQNNECDGTDDCGDNSDESHC